jgi:hypothetical protein
MPGADQHRARNPYPRGMRRRYPPALDRAGIGANQRVRSDGGGRAAKLQRLDRAGRSDRGREVPSIDRDLLQNPGVAPWGEVVDDLVSCRHGTRRCSSNELDRYGGESGGAGSRSGKRASTLYGGPGGPAGLGGGGGGGAGPPHPHARGRAFGTLGQEVMWTSSSTGLTAAPLGCGTPLIANPYCRRCSEASARSALSWTAAPPAQTSSDPRVEQPVAECWF